MVPVRVIKAQRSAIDPPAEDRWLAGWVGRVQQIPL
jgi:hypothetical protein